ncbi:hypothetical protein H7J07_05185 [Mycobacterium koreense]|uniref:Uncharacterized protein n=1 Tax=Mycolicibacillus koreensis TaxID=1069220 RepID=A0A7I7SD08_9MYCO|nr:hypothetical protein [Mycolicibacillus koreensis]MCV7247618.1 hypothetical protein [Mycolicibacillus koreensis]OSC32807.1 hypothetical protein B8W67_13720 [Mycolicibacillus koreensis]BBY53996.1 hypothetical protein MKOR_12470 [Mycolicibacillus koreensis]
MSFATLPGFRDAIQAAADFDAFTADAHGEYSRGQAELIQALFVRNDSDPGSGAARAFIRDEIVRARR